MHPSPGDAILAHVLPKKVVDALWLEAAALTFWTTLRGRPCPWQSEKYREKNVRTPNGVILAISFVSRDLPWRSRMYESEAWIPVCALARRSRASSGKSRNLCFGVLIAHLEERAQTIASAIVLEQLFLRTLGVTPWAGAATGLLP